jgi:LuxR family quorum sensing-dependent transcriptional regulator
MRADTLVFDFIRDLDERTSAEDVGAAFQRLVGKFGFTHFIIGRITATAENRGEMWAQSWPRDWYQIWTKQYYRFDPMVERARRSRAPFRWADMRLQTEAMGLHVFEEATAFGIHDGFSSSYSLGDGAVAGVTIGTSEHDVDPRALTRVLLASACCETKLAQLMHTPSPAPSPLSARERECLHWVAAGKTDWDISEIIGISQQTTHKHVSNALRKLGASTRAHAVAIALSTNAIEP